MAKRIKNHLNAFALKILIFLLLAILSFLLFGCQGKSEQPITKHLVGGWEIGAIYKAKLKEAAPAMLFIFLFVLSMGAAVKLIRKDRHKKIATQLPFFVLVSSVFAGLFLAWKNKAIFDDAFISFRYAENLLDGHGLVFNVGEKVEGYTNFLWTIIIAGLTWVLKVDMPVLAMFLCLVCFTANLIIVWLVGKKLNQGEKGNIYLPVAVIWLALQHVFHCYGTSGLETMLGSLLVNSAILSFISFSRIKGGGLAGFFLILATFNRPDHSLFYIALAIVIFSRFLFDFFSSDNRTTILNNFYKQGAAFSAPFLLYVIYLIWKYHYYGDILPNTYFAKSAYLTYWSQGLKYMLVSGLSSHFILIIPLFMIWLVFGPVKNHGWFRLFCGISVFAYMIYVAKIGGDFMSGRFYITLMPIMLLGIEELIHRIYRMGKGLSWIAIFITALVLSTSFGIVLQKQGTSLFRIADESSFYWVKNLSPLQIAPGNKNSNRLSAPSFLKEKLVDKGLSPVIATNGIGIIGYYSKLPLIDRRGLTDSFVAKMDVKKRSRPGHEKFANRTYLDSRNVRFLRARGKTEKYQKLRLGKLKTRAWKIYRYENKLMNNIRKVSPKIKFVRFPKYLDKKLELFYLLPPLKAARLLETYEHFYFSINNDKVRRKKYYSRFIWTVDFENENTKNGKPDQYRVSPSLDEDFYIEGHQGACCFATPVKNRKKKNLKINLTRFIVTGDVIGFKIAGEKSREKIYAALLIENKEIYRATGKNTSLLNWIKWDISSYKGKEAKIIIVDNSNRGRILFDFLFEAHNKHEPLPQ